MAERQQAQQLQVHHQRPYDCGDVKSRCSRSSVTKALTVLTLLPVSVTLLALSGMTLAGTLTVLAIATPLFIIFSPVIVPVATVIGLAVMSFLASGAFGLTGLSLLSRFAGYLQHACMALPGNLELARHCRIIWNWQSIARRMWQGRWARRPKKMVGDPRVEGTNQVEAGADRRRVLCKIKIWFY